jgi:DNA-binding transcriptional LysR family regulator
MFDWDDLKHLLAVARHGSTLAAGRALGVDQSTVQRRLAELERRLGHSLVERHPSGYRLTDFGREMLPAAERMAEAANAFEAHLQVAGATASGVIRMTCPEPIVKRLAQTALFDKFHARHPQWRVQFVMSDKYLDLMKGDADVALRSGNTEDGELIGRKIGDSIWAVYASRSYLERHPRPQGVDDLKHHALVGFDDSMAGHRASQWLREIAPASPLAARSSSVLGLIQSVKAGIGIGPLPLSLGDAEPDLVRVLGPVPELARIWRILTTPTLRHEARIAAFFDFIVDEIDTLRPTLTG